MYDQDLMMSAFDHKNPLRDIVYLLSNVDSHIEHLCGRPISIVHFLEYDLNDLCKLERWLRDRKPIDQHHDDWLHVHESLEKKKISRFVHMESHLL